MRYYRGFTLLFFLFLVSVSSSQSKGYWWNQSVFYEIFVRSFYDSNSDGRGDFKGLIEKLDYLNDGNPETDTDLGITGIWLMPINPSPSYHGYDVTDYRGIESDYGSMDDFHEFMDSCKARGIKVVVDFVMNHSSTQHPWFINSATGPSSTYRDWYIWEDNNPGYNGSWGQQVWHQRNGDYYFGMFWGGMPDMNMANEDTKNEFFDISKFWLDSMRVDGFRLDAIKHLFEDGTDMEHVPATFEFLEEFKDYYKAVNPEAMTVGEVWSSTSWVAQYANGDRLDFCFEFDLAQNIINGVRSNGWTGIHNHMASMLQNYRALQYAPFLSNHDQDRVFSQINKDEVRMKLAAAVLLTLPGVPFIYYGEELGMTGTGAHENIRTPMQWDNTRHAGFTSGNPWRSVNSDYTTKNVAAQQADPNSILSKYRKLIHIRNNSEALKIGDYDRQLTNIAQLYTFKRSTQNEYLIVMHNFSTTEAVNPSFTTYSTPYYDRTVEFVDLISGVNAGSAQSDEIGGFTINTNITIAPRETAILKLQSATTGIEEDKTLSERDFHLASNYPNPFNPSTTLRYTLHARALVKLSVYDVLGKKVDELVNEVQDAGVYSQQFNAENLSSGMYIQQLEVTAEDGSELFRKSGKMLLLK